MIWKMSPCLVTKVCKWKDWFWVLNSYMKTRDWNVLNKEILQIFLHLFNFIYVLKFFNKKVFWAFKLKVQYIPNKPLLTSLAFLVKILIFTVIFSISNKFVGPLQVRDRESTVYWNPFGILRLQISMRDSTLFSKFQ